MTIRFTMVRTAAALSLLASVLATACSRESLLEVETPDIVTPANARSAAGAQAYRAAAVGDFTRFIAGDRNGSSPLGIALPSGLLADEIFSARAGTEHMDNRSINPNNFPIDTWRQVGNSYGQLLRAINLVTEFPPATGRDAQLAELRAMKGFVLTITAELYCNGLPFWKGVEGDLSSETLTTAEMYDRAIAEFDQAMALLGTSTAASDVRTRNFALVGKARTLLDQYHPTSAPTKLNEAAAVAAQVPSGFVWNTEFSSTAANVANSLWDWMRATRNFGASDREGINGLDYVSSRDPRVRVDPAGTQAGQDGTPTPRFDHYPNFNSPVVVASSTEARLIEAEAQLAAGDPTWLVTLNALRSGTTGLTPLVDPVTPQARQDLLFRERAFWMYITGHRLGDMRRLIRQYGRDAETVFPTGPYFKSGRYGTDVTLVPHQAEQNNKNWYDPANGKPGCIDIKA